MPHSSIPEDWPVLVDETSAISVAVPPEWADVDLAPDEGQQPFIEAAPHREVFVATFEEPGVTVMTVSFTEDTDELVVTHGLADGCFHEVPVMPVHERLLHGIRAGLQPV